ncbi:MAG: sigma-70 family RNA polymerase sigma factor [Blastocatellia bacterium]|nr:sigma-70 family RNA polymerase sigma factor [Blastocatellia bacterium]
MKNSSDTRELSDEELVLRMADNKQNLVIAKAAWGELYERHREYVFKVLCKISGKWLGLDDELRRDFVSEVFIKAYLRANTYTPQNFTDPDQSRRWVRAWIGKIAKHLLVDWQRRNKGIIPLSYDDEKNQEEVDNSEEMPLFHKQESSAKVQRALEKLNLNERLVLRAYAPYWKGEGKQLIIPDDELTELAETLGTSKANIRQIKKRVLDKIKRMSAEDSP